MKTLKTTLVRWAKKIVRTIKTPSSERVHFNIASINRGHHSVTYRGIPTLRCPFDYVMYQMILSEVKPDLVIEIGTNKGGTSLYLANLMDAMGVGSIHTIDIQPIEAEIVKSHPRIKLFTKGWQDYDISEAKGFKRILVIEDASHLYEDSIGSLQKFSPLVTKGSYYIVEDGIINQLGQEKGFHGGPLRAINEFLAKDTSFVIDRKYCDMFGKNATWNVNGYLRKI